LVLDKLRIAQRENVSRNAKRGRMHDAIAEAPDHPLGLKWTHSHSRLTH